MATIEERAEQWVRANFTSEYIAHQDGGFDQILVEAYLAGVAQARQDEAEHQAWEQAGKPGRVTKDEAEKHWAHAYGQAGKPGP